MRRSFRIWALIGCRSQVVRSHRSKANQQLRLEGFCLERTAFDEATGSRLCVTGFWSLKSLHVDH